MRYTIPGAKQGGNRWDATRTDGFRRMGYERSPADPSMYVRNKGKQDWVAVVTIVDDYIITGGTDEAVSKAKEEISEVWEMVDQGNVEWCLNLAITRDRPGRRLKIDQKQYTQEVLHRFNMANCKPAGTPSLSGVTLTPMGPGEKQSKETAQLPFRQLTGALLYLRLTRPDILVPTTIGAKRSKDWTRQAWKWQKQSCRYLKGTPNWGLEHKASRKWKHGEPVEITTYVDADYATDPEVRASRTGYFIFVNDCVVAYGSRLQKGAPSQATCEAEYRALATCVKEAVWVMMIVQSLGIGVKLSIKVWEDNQSAIKLTTNHGAAKMSKHIAVRYHYIRDLQETGVIDVDYISTTDQRADILTKNLGRVQLERLRVMVMSDSVYPPG